MQLSEIKKNTVTHNSTEHGYKNPRLFFPHKLLQNRIHPGKNKRQELCKLMLPIEFKTLRSFMASWDEPSNGRTAVQKKW